VSTRDELAKLIFDVPSEDPACVPSPRAIADAIIADGWTKQAPCVMTHTPPFDFAQCETHDETFPLGEVCRFHERDMVEVLFEAADQQRMRAVRAEHKLSLASEAIESLRNVITTSSLDWGAARDIAWVYGIVVGWDSDPDDDDDLDAMGELAERFNWTPERVAQLRHFHRALGGAQ